MEFFFLVAYFQSLLIRFIIYGALGLQIEVYFTGFRSLIDKNWRATAQTYLWMHPIYGFSALLFDGIHWLVPLHPLLMTFVFTALIYAIEFTSGWVLTKLIGRCPWDYGLSKWTPMGLINFKYLPFWIALSFGYSVYLRMYH